MAPPSAPRDVNLTVISTTELGVYWHKPLFSGSTSDDTVVKYLVEWDKTSAFAMSAATVGGPTYSEATSHSHVTTETKYQIIGLEQGQEYYVRVSAFGASPSQDRPLKAEQYDTMVQAAGVDASVIAERALSIIENIKNKTRYRIDPTRMQNIMLQLFPKRVADRMIAKRMKIIKK